MEEQNSKRGKGIFLVRLWLPTGDDPGRWSGRAINIISGRACSFVQPDALGALLIEMMGEEWTGNVAGMQISANGESNDR